MSNATSEAVPAAKPPSTLAYGGAQWETISIWSQVDGFDFKTKPDHRRLLEASWVVAMRGSDEGDPPTKILIRKELHDHTRSRNKDGVMVRDRDEPHITVAWTTKKLNEGSKTMPRTPMFRTAHGYIDKTNPAALKVVSIRFSKDGDGKDTPQNASRVMDGQIVRAWPPNNEGRETESRTVLNSTLPADWKDIVELPAGTEPILTA